MSAQHLQIFDPATEPDPARSAPTHSPSGRKASSASRRLPRTGGEVIRLYLASLERRFEAGQISKTHLQNYRRSLDAAPRDAKGKSRYVGFIEVVGDIPTSDLIQDDLERWIEMNPTWKGPDSRRNNSAAAIACFNWADGRGLLKPTPFKRTEPLKEELVTRRDATDEENAKIWQAASPALRRILWLIDRAGLRTCEARELLWDWIDWDRAVIRLDKHKASRKQKKKRPRIIGLDAEALAELRRWHGERRDGQRHVFLSPRRRPWSKNSLGAAFRTARRKAGLPSDLTPYCFRHRFCTDSQRSGVPIDEVSPHMGHSTKGMTEGYTHLDDKPEHKAAVANAAKAIAEKIAAARHARRKCEPTPLFDGLE